MWVILLICSIINIQYADWDSSLRFREIPLVMELTLFPPLLKNWYGLC